MKGSDSRFSGFSVQFDLVLVVRQLFRAGGQLVFSLRSVPGSLEDEFELSQDLASATANSWSYF